MEHKLSYSHQLKFQLGYLDVLLPPGWMPILGLLHHNLLTDLLVVTDLYH